MINVVTQHEDKITAFSFTAHRRHRRPVPAEMAGVQRAIEICEQYGYGWCLWAHGDWADGFDTYGAQIKTRLSYPLITGKEAH